jgi:isochorismate pyruvate lyase
VKEPDDCGSIGDVREAIDGLDREVLRLLGRRARYVSAAVRFKTDAESVRAPGRQKEMLARRRRWAEEEDLDPDFTEALYGDIVAHFVGREIGHWEKDRA